MYSYKKQFVDNSGNYVIIQVRDDGLERRVDENHHGYQEWLSLGNIPEEIPYVEPPEPDPADVLKAQLAATDAGMARVSEDLIKALIAAEVITFEQLPLAAQNRLNTRSELRQQLAELTM